MTSSALISRASRLKMKMYRGLFIFHAHERDYVMGESAIEEAVGVWIIGGL